MTKEKDAELGGVRGLIAGYLDVKLPARNRRRRFGPWKSWRRHWVEARFAADDSAIPDGACGSAVVELALSPSRLASETGMVRVPTGGGAGGASVCRTASRSRGHAFVITTGAELGGDVFLASRSEADMERWMTVLQAAIASRAPATTATPISRGLSAASVALLRGRRLSRSEGDLLALPLGLPSSGDISPGVSGDISPGASTLRVPSPGEIRRGRTSTNASTTSTLGRSQSRQADRDRQSHYRQPFRLLYGRRRAETLRADELCADKLSTTMSPQASSGSALSLLGGKIASGLISAGLGLILSTPGGSEVEDDDADLDGDVDVDEEGDVPAMLPIEDVMANLALDKRRESAVSVASGIYEEILDSVEIAPAPAPGTPTTPTVVIDRVYENAAVVGRRARRASNGCESHYEDPALLFSPTDGGSASSIDGKVHLNKSTPTPAPPPLPPRQNLTPISELLTRSNGSVDSGFSFSHCTALDANGYVQMGLVRKIHAARTKCRQPSELSETEPAYMPMSPLRPFLYESQDKNM